MYEEFYDLKEKPFSLTPDPKFFFLSEHHRAAFEHLLYGIREKAGFLLIIGEVGIGKTTLCRALLERLGKEVNVALIFNPSVSEVELLQAILMDFGLKVGSQDKGAGGQSKKDLIDELNRFLLEEQAKGRTSALIIDEAQALSSQVLEETRLLSNLETEKEKLLQIILMGQPELKKKLELLDLRQLNQRISVRYTLQPLRKDEVALYIHHRLTTAGSLTPPIFTDAAIRAIHTYSQGIPRLINIACDRALLCGYVRETHRITSRTAQKGIQSIKGDYRERGLRGFFKRHLILSGSLVLLPSLLFALFSTGFRLPISGLWPTWKTFSFTSKQSVSQHAQHATSPALTHAKKEEAKEVEGKQDTPPAEVTPEAHLSPPSQEREEGPLSEELRAESPELRANSPEPRAKSPEPSEGSKPQDRPYTVQVVSLSTEDEALNEVETAKKLGYPVFLAKTEQIGGETQYRVFLGRFASYREAKAVQRKLQQQKRFPSAFVVYAAERWEENESHR